MIARLRSQAGGILKSDLVRMLKSCVIVLLINTKRLFYLKYGWMDNFKFNFSPRSQQESLGLDKLFHCIQNIAVPRGSISFFGNLKILAISARTIRGNHLDKFYRYFVLDLNFTR